ncbi:MAG TPA: hypothetical protein VJJ26_01250 [Candidatus Babeliales bacterium]|nr:hypothetical protein [Candidatus Babeliales bacterium]
MKKYLVLLSVFFVTSSIHAKREVFAHSFMYTKPGYYDIVMEQALWHDIEFNKKGHVRGGFQAIPFFQNSMSLDKNARYFLMNGKTELLVAGDQQTADLETRDIRAEWVNLPSTFRGFLSVNPKQQQKGCLFEYHQDLKTWFDVRFLRDMYIQIQLPVSVVKNNIHLTQTNVINQGTDFPQNIIQAFNQPSWCFSRIDNCQKKKVGVAELTIKLGTSYISEEFLQLDYYTVLAIPTGNKQNGETMFEPVNGNNHHLGIGGGLNIQVPFNRDTTNFAFCGFIDLESVILIRNKQFRTYDLFDKPWSRFLLMNVIGAQPNTNQPGVNYMTQRITAKPFNIVDFALGWRFHTPTMEAEIGYGIWGHGNERTNLKQPAPAHIFGLNGTTPVITDQPIPFGIAGSAPGKTASRSTIAFKAPDDLEFVPITTCDLDPQSGESYGGFAQRAFGSIGWINKGETSDSILGIGWSVDVPFHNSLLQLWKVWIKLAATF